MTAAKKAAPAPKTTAITAPKKPGALATIRGAVEKATTALTEMATLLSSNPKPGPLATAYFVIDKQWKKIIEAQREEARALLLNLVQDHGEAVEGSKCDTGVNIDYDGETFRVIRRAPRSNLPDAARFNQLLQSKGLALEAGCDQEISYKPNADKIAALVASKKLTAEEVDNCRKDLPVALLVEKL